MHLALALTGQTPGRRRALNVLLLALAAIGVRACTLAHQGSVTRGWSVVVVAALVTSALSMVQVGPPSPVGAPAGTMGADAAAAGFRRRRILAVGAVVAWLLGLGSCTLSFTTSQRSIAIAGAFAGIFLLVLRPLLLPCCAARLAVSRHSGRAFRRASVAAAAPVLR